MTNDDFVVVVVVVIARIFCRCLFVVVVVVVVVVLRNSLDNVFVPPSKRTHSTFILSLEGVRMHLIAWVFHDNVASGI